MFGENNLLSSPSLPKTIWLTSSGGTGEKPDATTDDCSRMGTSGKGDGMMGENPAVALKGEGAMDDTVLYNVLLLVFVF